MPVAARQSVPAGGMLQPLSCRGATTALPCGRPASGGDCRLTQARRSGPLPSMLRVAPSALPVKAVTPSRGERWPRGVAAGGNPASLPPAGSLSRAKIDRVFGQKRRGIFRFFEAVIGSVCVGQWGGDYVTPASKAGFCGLRPLFVKGFKADGAGFCQKSPSAA